jgi:hypothetical protein
MYVLQSSMCYRAPRKRTNFSELRKPEVQLRRILLPRTPVNKGRRRWAEAARDIRPSQRGLFSTAAEEAEKRTGEAEKTAEEAAGGSSGDEPSAGD